MQMTGVADEDKQALVLLVQAAQIIEDIFTLQVVPRKIQP